MYGNKDMSRSLEDIVDYLFDESSKYFTNFCINKMKHSIKGLKIHYLRSLYFRKIENSNSLLTSS